MLTFKQKVKKIILTPLYLLPIKKNRISFICYNCTQYSCNPKYISEYLHKYSPSRYEVIWFFNKKEIKKEIPDYVKKIKKNSLSYFIALATSEYIISNVTLPRIVTFKSKQKTINTWHGTAFKGDKNKYGNDYNRFKYFIAENELTSEVFRKKDSFNYQGEIKKIGMPRNDILINQDKNRIMSVREKIGVSRSINILLYAPTFREDIDNAPFNIDFERLIESLQKKNDEKWIVLFRYHHMQKGRINLKDSIDVTTYPDMQELLLVSDILITDYSSCMWDFSLMNKPVFLYAEDIEKYILQERGEFYYPIEKLPFAISKNNEELNENILKFDTQIYKDNISKYHQAWGRYNYNGSATKRFVAEILK
ncbi:MAG: CDP-glycerol glycerophosphotransferase family protein [Mediterraneibacter faecis]|nr:CDP-glycerol glycerophosphotransferase family protein [Mediterraneibacter faecis]